MRIIILIIAGFFLISLADANAVFAADAPFSGNVWEYKEQYVPREFHPTPEYMVYVDLGMLVLIMLVGLFFVIRQKQSRLLSLMAIITLVYLGVIRGGCICPVGLSTNIVMGIMNPAMIGLAATIVFLSPLLIALVAGRIFCTAGCPLGAVQHLFYKKKKHYKLPAKINTLIKIFPIAILIATIFFAVKGSRFFACELDPYKAVFFTGQAWFEQLFAIIKGNPMENKLLWAMGLFAWIYLIAILVAGYWVPRPFCRLLCPYGVLLGGVALFAFKRRSIKQMDCTFCGRCEKVCPTQAITIDQKSRVGTLSSYDCIQCNLCGDSCKTKAVRMG
jgi:ferredoxin-type protein NapH